MTRRLPLAALLAACLAVAAFGAVIYTRFSAPAPTPTALPASAGTPEIVCNTCDARHAARQRLGEKLQSKAE